MNHVKRCAAVVTLVALAGVACSDIGESGPAAPTVERVGSNGANAKSNADGPEWSGYAADIETTIDLGAGKRTTNRTHIERTLDASDRWITRITLAPRRGVPVDAQSRALVATVEMADDGSLMGVFDGEGRSVATDELLEGTLPKSSANRAGLSFPAFPAAGVSTARRTKVDRHAWLDDAVVTPKAAERIARRLAKHMTSAGEERGKKKFVRQGNVTAETLVDGSTGAIVEEKAQRGKQRSYHASHSYSRLADGSLVRTRSRIEYTADGRADPVIVERTLTNVKLTPGGTQ
jgi:hypothetical protein